jgi:molybdopterin molybdotransferase
LLDVRRSRILLATRVTKPTAAWWSWSRSGTAPESARRPASDPALLAVWQRIEAWLSTHAKRIHKGLAGPASDSSIAQVEAELGLTLPPEYRASLLIHDGERKDVGSIRGWRLNSLAQLLEEYRVMSQVLRSESFLQYANEVNGPGLKPGYWQRAWIPIASDRSANHYLMDLDPAPDGVRGQIFVFDHEQGAEPVEARGFLSWLEQYASELEANQVVLTAGELRSSVSVRE